MKRMIEILTAAAAITLICASASAQTAQQYAGDATAKTQAALAATGLPPWAWIVIAAVVILALIFALARRRRRTQAIIKTRLG